MLYSLFIYSHSVYCVLVLNSLAIEASPDDTMRKKSASYRLTEGIEMNYASVRRPATFISGNNYSRSFISTTQSNFAPLCA